MNPRTSIEHRGAVLRLGRQALLAAALLAAPLSANAADTISAEEAHSIGVEAYLYFYPLVTMDLTRRQLTNIEPSPGAFGGPANWFNNIPEFPPANLKVVVRPNFDTLYSSAWLDLRKEPVVVSVPDTGGRYYLLPMLDMWTDVFASPGWRTTGTAAGNFLIAPADWRPDLRDKFDEFKLPAGTQRLDAPTPYVWIIGRTKTDGPADYDAVHKVQDGFKVTPLSEWGKTAKTPTVKVDPTVDMMSPPKIQVDTLPAGAFFAYAAELLKEIPPHSTDQPILARLKRIGFEPGKSFNIYEKDAVVRDALVSVPDDAQALMKWKIPTLARVANNWSLNTDTMGVYGNYYLKRAIIAQQGLGANLPEDAIYPMNLADGHGDPLDGVHNYQIHFDKDQLPPADAFWSVTLYDEQGYQVANPLNRFAVSSWMPFKYNGDGSLDLYFQNQSPGQGLEFELAAGAKGAVQPDDAPLRAGGSRPDRKVDATFGREGGPGPGRHDQLAKPGRGAGHRLAPRPAFFTARQGPSPKKEPVMTIGKIALGALALGALSILPGLSQAQDAISAPGSKTIGVAKQEIVPSLIVLNADGATLDGETLTLTGVSKNAIIFADRPVRSAGHALTAHLIEEWGDGSQSFAKDPPNATVSVLASDASSVTDAVVVLKSPKLDGDKLTFNVQVLEGSLKSDGPAAIFIDIIGLPRTPVSFAGAARRTAYRGAWYGGAAVAGAAVAGAAVGAAVGAAAAAPYYGYGYPPPPACGYYPYPPCY